VNPFSRSPFVAELVSLKKRVSELEKLFFGLAPFPPHSPSQKSNCRFRAGKRLWNPEDDELLRQRYPHEANQMLAVTLRRSISGIYGRAAILGLKKTDEYLSTLAAASRLPVVGARFRFSKGHVPANKGLRRPGYAPGRMADTQFKKGVRQGVAVRLYKPIGTERVSKDGYLERKVNDDLPLQRRWRAVHLVVWEAANGPLPQGHAVAFKNGDKTDVRLENLECITRRELMARNTVHNLPKDLVNVIQLLGAVNRQINKRTKHDEKHN
jgi:hypothetical protein